MTAIRSEMREDEKGGKLFPESASYVMTLQWYPFYTVNKK